MTLWVLHHDNYLSFKDITRDLSGAPSPGVAGRRGLGRDYAFLLSEGGVGPRLWVMTEGRGRG